MDGKSLAILMTVLMNKKPGAEHWNEGHEFAYQLGLRDIPNSALEAVVIAINDEVDWRPEVAEIKAIWRRMNGQSIREHEIIGEIRAGIQKFGANGDREPGTNFYRPGPPPGLSSETLAVVNNLGGWVRVAEDACMMESGVWLGHMRGMARSVVAGESDDRLRQIGSEYNRQRTLIESGDEEIDSPSFPEGEGGGRMRSLGDLRSLIRPADGR